VVWAESLAAQSKIVSEPDLVTKMLPEKPLLELMTLMTCPAVVAAGKVAVAPLANQYKVEVPEIEPLFPIGPVGLAPIEKTPLAAGPVAPTGPVVPCAPAAPVGPVIPCAPVVPALPVAPVGPLFVPRISAPNKKMVCDVPVEFEFELLSAMPIT